MNNKILFYFDIEKFKKFKKFYYYLRICIVFLFFFIVFFCKLNDMFKSVFKIDLKDSFVVCLLLEWGFRVFGVVKCFSESGGIWYDN